MKLPLTNACRIWAMPASNRGFLSHSIWRRRLRGGTLIYTLYVGMIVTGIFGVYILMNFLQQKQLDRLHYKTLAQNNAASGMELQLAKGVNWGTAGHAKLFADPLDSIHWASERWGLLGLMHVKGQHAQATAHLSALIGGNVQGPHRFSLLLEDSREALTVVGKTHLSGPLYVPALGIRPGTIGRRGFEGTQVFTGTRHPSQGKKMKLDMTWLDPLAAYAERWQLGASPDIYEWEGRELTQAWEEPTEVLEVQGGLVVASDCSIYGKVKIVASTSIRVRAGAKLEHCLLIAPEIHIESGFSGRIQALATRQIRVGDSSQLGYPSMLCLAKTDAQPGVLTIGEGTELEGAILYLGRELGGNRVAGDFCRLEKGSEIVGLVHVSHNLDLQGEVKGRVSTGNFLLQTPGATYRNHLLDARIGVGELSPTYAGPLLFSHEAMRVISWLPVRSKK